MKPTNNEHKSNSINDVAIIKVALDAIKPRKDCIFIIMGTQWSSDNEIMEMAIMERHHGIILINGNETNPIEFGNELLCQVTIIKNPGLLHRAEGVCKKPIHADCLTVLILNKNDNANHRLIEQQSKNLTVAIVMISFQDRDGTPIYQIRFAHLRINTV